MSAHVATELVKRTAVGNFLGVDLAEVQRLIEMDDLPHVKVPGAKQPAVRIFLPDLHAWLAGQSRMSPKLADFSEFRRAFFAAQPDRPPKQQQKPKPA